jgi:hypothetical protein
VRESGLLYPEKAVVEEIIESGLLQKLYRQTFGNTDALDKVLDDIRIGLERNVDSSDGVISLCSECGYLSLDPMKQGCPHCSSMQIEVF